MKRSIWAMALALPLVLAGLWSVNGPNDEQAPARSAWEALRLAALDEVEGYHDVRVMRDASDLVVVGTFLGFDQGRRIVIPNGMGEGEDDVLIWIDGRLRIEQILHIPTHMQPLDQALADDVLSADGNELTVEFFAGSGEAAAQINDSITDMNTNLVGPANGDHRVVLFLRLNGGPNEPTPYIEQQTSVTPQKAADACKINVDEKVMARVPKGEIFDPARHYPGYKEKVHGSCLFLLPGDGAGSAPAIQQAQGDVDDLGRLRLVWSYGLITGTQEHPVDAPLGEFDESEEAAASIYSESGGEDPRDQWNSLDDFITYVMS